MDSEFIEDGETIDLVSIGLISENGAEFYAQSTEYDASKASPWVVENVFSQLSSCINDAPHMKHTEQCSVVSCPWRSRAQLRNDILAFINKQSNSDKLEFWASHADYDWVAFCQIFGKMIDLPQGWPHYCHDLAQWREELGNPQLPEQVQDEHQALNDARWDRDAWEFLSSKASTQHSS